jgi:signal transduction histidine kinase
MRRRLALIVLAVTGMVTVAFLLPLAAVVRVVAADRALTGAEQEARSLAGVLSAITDAPSVAAVVDDLNAGSARTAAVFLPDGSRIGAGLNVSSEDLARARAGTAFTTSPGGGRRVWMPVRSASGSVTVAVVEAPARLVHEGVYAAWAVLAGVGALVLLLGVALADRLARSLVTSIEDLGHLTRRLQRGDLNARILPSGPPEVTDVGAAVNELADRIGVLLAAEREAAADLSHRLRTPLTALELEAGNLTLEGDRRRMLAAVHELTSEVNAVIRETRHPGAAERVARADLADVTRERLQFWSVLAEDQGRRWSCQLPSTEVPVGASVDDVTTVLDALLTNVFGHTREGTAFRVVVMTDESGVGTLVVEDDGPGLPRQRLGRGVSTDGSTGLGLDIARRTAERSGGALLCGPAPGGGARLVVSFGRPALERSALECQS